MGHDAKLRARRRTLDRIRREHEKRCPKTAHLYTSPKEIAPELREALYAHEILRRAKYNSSQLWLAVKDEQIVLVVKDRGGTSAGLVIADTQLSDEDLRRDWPGAVHLWNATCNTDPCWDFEGSRIRQCAVNMLADLITNKIRPDEEKANGEQN